MPKKPNKYDELWAAMEKIGTKHHWLELFKTEPQAAWQQMATNCAEDAHTRNFPTRRGTYVINDVPTDRGQVVCHYNNNPYKKPGYGNAMDHSRRDKETDFFRARIREAGIDELAYATYPGPGKASAGYTYAMILDAGDSQLGIIHDAMREAMGEAEEWNVQWDEAKETDEAGEDEDRPEVDEAAPGATTVNVGATSRVSQTRVGQDAFSRAVRANYGHRCCFPGCDVDHDSLLVAAHIARWADDLESRGDVANGLCLCGLHDKAFECGLFTLTDEFRVKVDRSTASAWVEAHLATIDGLHIKLGRIRPSARAVRQHRDRHA